MSALRDNLVPVSLYMVNGIRLQGQIVDFDQFVVVLKSNTTHAVYKHALATIVPARAG